MLISELKVLVRALHDGVEQDKSFFSGILGYVRQLSEISFANFGPDDLATTRVAIAQIWPFFVQFEDHGTGFYLEPSQTRDLRSTVARISEIVEEIASGDLDDLRREIGAAPSESKDASPDAPLPRRVFVVHGHASGPREAVARLLEHLEFEAVILEQQPNQGRTVIEKFVAYADASYAVVLMTPDDVGGPREAIDGAGDVENLRQALHPRARQNVVLELGFFIGRLGRDHVAALVPGSVELPSDVEGVVYIPLDDAGAWKLKLAGELRAIGFSLDMNKLN